MGNEAPWCALLVGDGGTVSNAIGYIGYGTGASSNVVSIAGAGSLWLNTSDLYVGYQGWQNVLQIGNGAQVGCRNCFVGYLNNSSENVVVIDGAGSLLRVQDTLMFGASQARNRLVITNGGVLTSRSAYVGTGGTPFLDMYNAVVVTGPGSMWENRFGIRLGTGYSRNNSLAIQNGGMLKAEWLIAGTEPLCAPNTVVVEGGELILTNDSGTGFFDARYGTANLNGGMLLTDLLVCTNSGVNFFSGTIATKATLATKSPFYVRNGTGPACFHALGGVHTFSKGLILTNTARLCGTGNFSGNITNAGTIRPGASTGAISVSGHVVLLNTSALEFELAGTDTNDYDRLLITGNLTADGTVTVTLANGFAPRVGDTFKLLAFTGATGAFSAVNLPEDYTWTNRLLIDGTISVIGLRRVRFDPPQCVGTNLILAGQGGVPARTFHLLSTTNILLPLSNWQVLMTNTFGPDGGFSVTTRIDPQTPHRFFRLAY